MADMEVISRFMEPDIAPLHDSAVSVGGWWVRQKANVAGCVYEGPWQSAIPAWSERVKLGAMHEVEARLSEDQRECYIGELWMLFPEKSGEADWLYVHASAEQKIRALAVVIRAGKEPRP